MILKLMKKRIVRALESATGDVPTALAYIAKDAKIYYRTKEAPSEAQSIAIEEGSNLAGLIDNLKAAGKVKSLYIDLTNPEKVRYLLTFENGEEKHGSI